MRKVLEKTVSWVVYKMASTAKVEGQNVVCEQHEWERIESAKPGLHTLIRAGISNEGEAERLARGTSGDSPPRRSRSSVNGPGAQAIVENAAVR